MAPRPVRPGLFSQPRRGVAFYPLARGSLATGLLAAGFTTIASSSVAGALVLSLFLLVGFSWRVEMPPVLSMALAYQWMAITAGYWYYGCFGVYPGGGDVGLISETVIVSMLGLAALLLGFRWGLRIFSEAINPLVSRPMPDYDMRNLFILTAIFQSISFVGHVAPDDMTLGGSQIIANLLALRALPYFILLLVLFERRSGYSYAWAATVLVILPELLTGFSRFKEILFVIVMAAATQWRPWVRTAKQRRLNLRIAVGAIGAALAIGYLGLIWTGALKQDWRSVVWEEGAKESASPVDLMSKFVEVSGSAYEKFRSEEALETLAQRLSSGTLYFSYTMQRVPSLVPHEEGGLFMRAMMNALIPRMLYSEKASLGGDSWLVRHYAGIEAAGDESGASIGLGYMAEFYIDLGYPGVLLFCIFFGFCAAACMALFARVAGSREVFFALLISLITSFLMSADGSFIKLFAGMVQRSLIAAALFAVFGRTFMSFVTNGRVRQAQFK